MRSTRTGTKRGRGARRGWVELAAAAALAACSPAEESTPASAPPGGGTGGDTTTGGSSDDMGISGLVDEDESGFAPVDESDACVVERADTVEFKEPVDIILVVDNSASMQDELAATELNINENFAAILEESALDYRLIVLSLHRRAPRTGFGQSATQLCVEAPLSGISDCADADEPRFTDRFFQYSTRIGSADSFDVLLDSFAPPFEDEAHEDEFGNAPQGWSEWLRPGIKKVFLEISDGNEDMLAADFARSLTELSPDAFGADPEHPSFVFHSIVNVAEKQTTTDAYQPDEPVQLQACDPGLVAVVLTTGQTYQELSRLTGGLRFPICESTAYDVVFREVAGRVVDQSDIACDFPLPAAPEGRELDLDRVSVSITHDGIGAPPSTLGQARLAADCASDAFFIDGGQIRLCPDVCSSVRGEAGARVDVLFGCESSIIVR